ncbi:MAG: Rne/Rng family ribonuclease [Phycisphaerales bacterium]
MARKPSTSDNGSTKADNSDNGTTKKKTSRSRSSGGRSSGSRGKFQSNAIESNSGVPTASRMIVNYIPGDTCRIAFVDEGKLEEYHAEPTTAVSRVNNIYFGVVRNNNTAVQAAFVDFGLDEHGFLHTTDVHPRYFPKNEDGAARVGIKTPRRDRPPIQKCFKPGDRIMVQVLKEGVGTKGPSLTSYISIPGRYLVMMPGMDNVGVSRKVEDEDQRRKMRKILDQLDLPEGFGFILRTAGMDRTKTELKRDLSYLKRLWSDMDKKQKGKKAPLPLYAESDLLLRALRDLAGNEVTEIIIDDPTALARAERFLKIAHPRSRPSLKRYTGKAPIFAAFGIEQQIQNIHSREVPLPSGGRLIFDETEALVAIDVNSGRSRSAKDAETNAFKTNMEAADEICRQLRLRDMGGLVINDLIDMRHASNRKAIEQRFTERLGRDRAKSTILPISEFGLLEMTRQRMRASHERTHFAECPMCKGRGVIRRPDSVAAEALRELALIASYDKIARVEMVVSAQVASHLLSGRRKQLSRIERTSGTITEVRVSETMSAERFVLYGYDGTGNDVELEKLPKLPNPEDLLEDAEGFAEDASVETIVAQADEEDDSVPEVEAHPIELDADFNEEEESTERSSRKRRRRRRRRRGSDAEAETAIEDSRDDEADEDQAVEDVEDDRAHHDADEEEDRPRRKRRRRRRGGRGRSRATEESREDHDDGDSGYEEDSLARRLATALSPDSDEDSDDDGEEVAEAQEDVHDDEQPRRRRRRRRRRGGRDEDRARQDDQESDDEQLIDTESESESDDETEDHGERPKRRRRRRRGSRRDDTPEVTAEDESDDEDLVEDVDATELIDEDAEEEEATEEIVAEAAPAGLIEPRPKRGRGSRGRGKSEAKEPAAPAKPKPRFLYAAHRKTKPSGQDGG